MPAFVLTYVVAGMRQARDARRFGLKAAVAGAAVALVGIVVVILLVQRHRRAETAAMAEDAVHILEQCVPSEPVSEWARTNRRPDVTLQNLDRRLAQVAREYPELSPEQRGRLSRVQAWVVKAREERAAMEAPFLSLLAGLSRTMSHGARTATEGPLLVWDADAGTIHEVYFDLPLPLRAVDPAAPFTAILVRGGQETVVRYTNGCTGVRRTAELRAFAMPGARPLGTEIVRGSSPPGTVKEVPFTMVSGGPPDILGALQREK